MIYISFVLVISGAENVDTLDLSGNFLSEFPTVALKLFSRLRVLNASSNVIEVSRSLFEKLPIKFVRSISVYINLMDKRLNSIYK